MQQTSLVKIHEEVGRELATPQIISSLLETRFKGLTEPLMRKAIVEGMIRGFSLKDFFEGNVYAIPFKMKKGDGSFELTYSIVTSLDNSRKIGAKSGIVGVEESLFGDDGEAGGLWASVTVHKQFPSGHIGDFTDKVYLKEYDSGKNLWISKPRTMLAKVAEMHALRKACPELAESYIAEEINRPVIEVKPLEVKEISIEEYKEKLRATKTLKELGGVWSAVPPAIKDNKEVFLLKEDLKTKYPDETDANA